MLEINTLKTILTHDINHSEASIIITLLENPDGLTVSELSEKLNKHPTTINSVCKTMLLKSQLIHHSRADKLGRVFKVNDKLVSTPI